MIKEKSSLAESVEACTTSVVPVEAEAVSLRGTSSLPSVIGSFGILSDQGIKKVKMMGTRFKKLNFKDTSYV